MKKLLLAVPFLCLAPFAQAASILDIGANYRLRGISTSKPDFGMTSEPDAGAFPSIATSNAEPKAIIMHPLSCHHRRACDRAVGSG